MINFDALKSLALGRTEMQAPPFEMQTNPPGNPDYLKQRIEVKGNADEFAQVLQRALGGGQPSGEAIVNALPGAVPPKGKLSAKARAKGWASIPPATAFNGINSKPVEMGNEDLPAYMAAMEFAERALRPGKMFGKVKK